jgi:hypothetical protein
MPTFISLVYSTLRSDVKNPFMVYRKLKPGFTKYRNGYCLGFFVFKKW